MGEEDRSACSVFDDYEQLAQADLGGALLACLVGELIDCLPWAWRGRIGRLRCNPISCAGKCEDSLHCPPRPWKPDSELARFGR